MCEEDVWKMTLDDRCVEPLLGWCQSEQWTLAQSSSDIDPPPATVCGVMCLSLGWVLFDLFNFSSLHHSVLQGLWVVVFAQLHTPLERRSLLPWESGWSLVWWIYIHYSLLKWMKIVKMLRAILCAVSSSHGQVRSQVRGQCETKPMCPVSSKCGDTCF